MGTSAFKTAAVQQVDAQLEQSSLASEEARLAALVNHNLLDTPAEHAFDNITKLAAALCDAPISLVTLVDRDRLFFKSKVGRNVTGRPRQGAFCDVVVRHQMPLVVNSARDDVRFADDPEVAEHGVQFYAGMPLTTADGHVLGSLCVLDVKPRALQDNQRTALEGLARQVVSHIETRSQVQALKSEQHAVRVDVEMFRSVLASSQEAVVIISAEGVIEQWGGTASAIFGYEAEEMIGVDFASLFVLSPIVAYNQSAGGVGSLWGAPPELFEVGTQLIQKLSEQPAGASPLRSEVYARRKDGSVCYLEVTGSRVRVEDSITSSWVMRDISARHQNEQQRDTLFRTSMVLSTLRNLPQAAPQLLQLIAMGLEWDLGNFWVEDAEQRQLVCVGTWSRRIEESLMNGTKLSEECIVEAPTAEHDLLSTAWSEGAATWVPDVSLQDDSVQLRLDDPKTRSLVCVPLISINECYGVLELTSEAVKPCDQDTMHCLQQIANQIGQFLRRYSVEQSMRASEQRFRSLFISTAVSMALLSSKGTMEAVNKALCIMLGRDEAQLLHQSFFRSVTFEDPEAIKMATQGMLAGSLDNFQCQVQCQHRDGHMVWAAANISVMQNENRATPGFVVQMLDMTAQRRSAEALHRAKELAEAATRAKSDFLARMSHEIRTPINGVIGMADLTMQTPLSFEQGQYLSVLRSSATSLLALVNDVLDFSKNEAGRMTLEEIGFSVRSLLEQSSAALMIRAREKDLKLSIDIGEDVPDRLKGDPQRLQQILVNLLANAVKFTLKGGVTVKVSCDDIAEGRVRLTFGVEDTGIGISVAERANLFKAFGQGNDSTHRRFGGTGLGLAICQQLVELMGGRIWIDSEPAVGSTFFFSLSLPEDTQPETLPTAANLLAAAAAPRRSLKVLVAEDNAVNRMVASGLLSKAGHAVTLVEDGHQAVAALGEGHGFDIVLMDLQMPLMGGLEATSTIRQRERGRGLHVPIIALTAQAMDGDQDTCLQAGMDAYLTKPLNLTELLYTLEVYTAMTQDTSKSTPSALAAIAAPSEAPYDRAELLERLSGDEELFGTIVEVFVGDLTSMRDGLNQAVRAHDAKRIEQAAHKLKGALLNLSAGPAANLAKSLEDMGRAGVLEAPELKAAALDQALTALQNALTQGQTHA